MATAEIIEVSLPFSKENVGWEYRILPWEFLLSAATEDMRSGRPLFVVRHLEKKHPAPAVTTGRFLYVEAAPPSLRADYDFESDLALARVVSGYSDGRLFDEDRDRLEDPTTKELAEAVRREPTSGIHISGFDSWLAAAELRNSSYAKPEDDGYLMPTADGAAWDVVRSVALAELLVESKQPPRLVTFNIFNSGARLAALCVSRGAAASIGYQDTFDSRLGEQFFAAFSRACASTNWDFAGSARYAWELLRKSGQPLVGSGMVVWLRDSIRLRKPESIRAIASKVEAVFSQVPEPATVQAGLEFDIKPKGRINYSMLHNRGAFFEFFIMRRKPTLTGRVDDIDVSITLQIGPTSFPFEMHASLSVHQTSVDLAPDIVVSLTSDLVRAVRDQIQTTLSVKVRHHEHVFYSRTHRVMLLPIDEWVDDDYGRRWLPSFVLARDLAVRRIIEAAQKYLVALQDDPGAGFDGYQSVEASAGHPEEQCESVDLQVRAIWSALMLDFPLAYINPPPTFTDKSQRIRTPNDTITGRRGTCIDLAVLFAACLEYVEIYPVIILLSGHAFPAYWRHSDYVERFMAGTDVRLPPEGETLDPDYVSALLGQNGRWSMGKGHYKEILQAIEDGQLVPVETVLMTSRSSFRDAIDEGQRNMMDANDFDSLIDINRARTDPLHPITPLPIRGEEV